MIGNELKAYDGLTSRQQLTLFRNLYYSDGNATEYGIIANAINDCFTADVVPKSEVAILTCQNMALENAKYELQHELNKYKGVEKIINDNMGKLISAAKNGAKQEVARKIFEEIELFLNKAIDGWKKERKFHCHDRDIRDIERIDFRNDAFKYCLYEIAELKKKYTEEKG